jgi:hypothetical protein
MSKIIAVLVAAAFFSSAVQAEIVKVAATDCKTNQICFYWWPKLPELKGWHNDSDMNFKLGDNGSNVLVPDGATFSDAPAVIYARAIYVKRYDFENNIKSTFESFIDDDKSAFRKRHPNIDLRELAPLKTADGQELKVVAFFRPSDKNWDCVAYGEEEGYYLMFVLSANSETAYSDTIPAYQDLIARYRQ